MEKGYIVQQALIEASRCLMCADAPCNCDCPAGVDARGFIRKIRFENLDGAVRLLKGCNVLAASCAYICPTGSQCAKGCSSAGLTRPIEIAALQRFVMDYEREHGMIEPSPPRRDGQKVAVIGSGPAGLGCAAELAVRGHLVTVFESAPKIGGQLRMTIPSFRLPPVVLDFEVEFIKKLGVEFECLKMIEYQFPVRAEHVEARLVHPSTSSGRTDNAKLFMRDSKGYDAVFLATGLQKSRGEELIGGKLPGVHQALDFLAQSKQGAIPELGKRVVVIGGGDTAIDSARVSKRAGAECFILYRRTQREMPAYPEEIEAAWNDGVEFYFRIIVRSVVGTDKVAGVRCVRIRWRERTPGTTQGYDVDGAEFVIPCDTVIYAVGQGPAHDFGLRTTSDGLIAIHKDTMMTSSEGIFAGGDGVTGGGTAAAAVGAGKKAAVKIDEYMKSR